MSGAYTRFGFRGACGKLQGVDDEVTGGPRSAGSTARDAAEIRGRIAACFSLAELRRFAQELGVPDIPWERGIKGAAHELVRRFEQRRELWALVEHLRAVRPLVEWPDLRTVPPASSVGQAHTDIPRPAPLPNDIPRPAPLPNLSPLPVPSPAAQIPPTLAPPPIPPTTRTPAVPVPEPTRARAPGAAPAYRPGGAERAPARASRRVDSRLLLAALGLVVASLVVAFLIGRASSGPGEEAARASDGRASDGRASAAPPALRPDGIAARAAAAVERRIESVARACEIPPGPAEDVMRRAFARCGPAPVLPAQRAAPAAQGGPPDAEPPSAPPPAAAAERRAPAAAGNAGCVGACDRRHKACRTTRCGSEPTQSSLYERYQSCLSTCLEEASRCRLGCL
ncbi:hypothetical protein [Sorangium sp. So ce233]|uniref:hypothetical protein n=1 Tax=Sorangium sp. So ce233 TaxID=3133290 RepID=UPI003F5EE824